MDIYSKLFNSVVELGWKDMENLCSVVKGSLCNTEEKSLAQLFWHNLTYVGCKIMDYPPQTEDGAVYILTLTTGLNF